MKLSTSTIVVRATIATAMLAGACSGSSGVASFEEEFSVSAALSEIPVSGLGGSDGVAQIVAADIDAAAKLAGVERPSQTDSLEDIFPFFYALRDDLRDGPGLIYVPFPVGLTMPLSLLDFDAPVEEAGFSIIDVSTYVAVRPTDFTVVTGVSPRADLEEVSPGISSAGRSQELAEKGDRVALSRNTDHLVDWLAGSPDGTAAGDPTLAAVAGRLDEQGVVSALLSRTHGGAILGFGLGWTVENEQSVGVMVFAYESTTEASVNLSEIEASLKGDGPNQNRLADQIAIDEIKVEDAEVIVIVSFVGEGSPETLYEMLITFAGPFNQI